MSCERRGSARNHDDETTAGNVSLIVRTSSSSFDSPFPYVLFSPPSTILASGTIGGCGRVVVSLAVVDQTALETGKGHWVSWTLRRGTLLKVIDVRLVL